MGEFECEGVRVKPGDNDAGQLTWEVPRLGKSIVWQIGVPDRRAAEFRRGDSYFHGYVWKDFSKDLPNPLVYTIGKSNPATDWNFAQGAYLKNHRVEAWPWEIRFFLAEMPTHGNARLTLAWASAHAARVSVVVNGKPLAPVMPPVSGGNALLREGIHAKYSFSHVDFPVSALKKGANTITLTQTRNQGAFSHVMYDSLTLELP